MTTLICTATCVVLVTALTVATTSAQSSTPDPGEPPFETFGALPWEEPPGAMPFVIESVADGDTIRVIEPDEAGDPDPWWEPVRLIGIDAPEKHGPFTNEECHGQEAADFLAGLLPQGSTVYLQVDNDEDIPDDEELTGDGLEVDDFERLLLHAYVRDGDSDDYYLVSEILALGGLVDVRDYEGNAYFVEELQDAEDIAQDEGRGLWGACAT